MPTSAKERVLLVDDEPQILVALEDLLSDDFMVFKAGSGFDALRVMENEEDIAVVISDQRMPRMAGDELVARINESYGAERILVTGYADLNAVVRAVNDGRIFAYVTKPWNEEDLRLKVEQAAHQFRLSQELTNEKRLLDDLMNNSPDAIYFKDRDLRFVRANEATARWYGMGVSDLVGKKLSEVLPANDVALRIEREERSSLLENRPIVGAVRQEVGETTSRWVSETKAPIGSSSGEALGLVGISRDVTRQRELEDELVQSQKMEAVGRLAGGVAHDFNNLLVVISSYGGLLKEELPPEDPHHEDLDELLKAADRAASLTSQLLTFSRRRRTKVSRLDLNEVITEVVKMLRRLMEENIQVVLELSHDLGWMMGDKTQVEQVLLNLAINARDAMPDGGRIHVSSQRVRHRALGATEESECIRLSVEDNGSGMSQQVQSRIFEPFFSTKEVGKGTGLGLSTVYGIVKQLEGDVVVTSELGKGTRFDVFFPLAQLSEAPSEVPPSKIADSRGTETILLVEDDASVRRVASKILNQRGYRVVEAGSPGEAIRICAEYDGRIHLLLTDVVMPEMDGLTLARELMVARPNMRVLYMSGYMEDEVNRTIRLNESDCYIEKPFRPEGLAEAVWQALGKD